MEVDEYGVHAFGRSSGLVGRHHERAAGKALEMQKETKERLGDVLIRAGFITEQPH
mgnify:CR=1 FL=1